MKRILVSDQSVNSYGFSVLTSGIDLSRFEGNPIMLFNHQRAVNGKTDDVLPIGTWKDLHIEDDKVYAIPVFDESDEFAVKIMKKFEAGVLRASSIGISITVMEYVKEDDALLVTKSQLQEISIVDIPSNQNAVAVYGDNDERMNEGAILALAAAASNPKPTIQPSMKFPKTVALLGLTADASDEAMAAKIKVLTGQADENVSLKAKVKTFEDAEKTRKAEKIVTLVDDAVSAGKITADQKETYTKLATADFDSTKSILDGMTGVVKLSSIPAKGGGKDDAGTYEGKTFDEMRRDHPKALLALKNDNTEAYKKLYEAYIAE